MKQLIILSLLIPMLCFATESESMSLEEETLLESEASTKLSELHRVQDAVEAAREATKTEVENEQNILVVIWQTGVFIFGAIAAAFILITGITSFAESIRFNYHLYIRHGKFCFLATEEDSDDRRDREEVAKNVKGFEIKQVQTYGWFTNLGMVAAAAMIFGCGVIIWPITVLALGPTAIINLVGMRKRKKRIFEDKLKGNRTNGTI